jgi:hypothetical protein
MPSNAQHDRSGAALYYIVSGTGANTVDGKTEAKGPGSLVCEPMVSCINGAIQATSRSHLSPLTLIMKVRLRCFGAYRRGLNSHEPLLREGTASVTITCDRIAGSGPSEAPRPTRSGLRPQANGLKQINWQLRQAPTVRTSQDRRADWRDSTSAEE